MPRKYQNPKLEVRQDVARPFYFIRVTIPAPDGKRRRTPKCLGYCDEITKKEAMKRRAEALDLVNAGRVLAESQVKFKELVAQFLAARVPQFGVGTQARYQSQIENHILPAFGDRKLSEIDRPTIEAWLAGKERDGYSWWSREGLRGVLSAIFIAARDWNLWSSENPTHGVRIGRKTQVREKRIITSEQFRNILAAVSDRTRFMLLIATLLGLRVSEICGLQWRDIEWGTATLSVRRRWYRGDLDIPKNDAAIRKLPLGPLIKEFSSRYARQPETEYIFTDDGVVPVDERDILRFELRPALKRLGYYYTGFGWHAFRRMFVTLMQTAAGATVFEVQRAAGHSNPDMTMLYTLTDPERELTHVTKMFEHLMPGASCTKQ